LGFAHPERFWFFAGYPFLVLWALRGRYVAQRSWRALAQRGRAPRDGTVWLLVSIACLIVALAQPRWGRLGFPPPPGHDVVLLVDTSRSMAAEDAVPNRLAVAVEAAESLVNALLPEPANRAALVAFAGRGVLRCPLTENLGAVVDALHRLQPGTVRPGGTDLGAALDEALDAIDPQQHAEGRTFVIFSDGEDHAERWESRLERLQQEEIVVHGVAIGDADKGHTVPSGKDAQPLRFDGQPVLSRRQDLPLEAVARATGGVIVRLGLTSGDLGALYHKRIEPMARLRRDTPRLADRIEQFPLFLMVALGLLVAACWPARRGGGWTWGWSWSGRARWPWPWKRTVGKLGIGAIALAVIGASKGSDATLSVPAAADSAFTLVARGVAAYRAEQWDGAVAAFGAAVSHAPDAPIPRYDLGAALFQMGRYQEAGLRYEEAREHAGAALRTKIDFARGNTALALGDIEGAIAAYDECLASRARGVSLDVVRSDAAINRQFALEQWQSPTLPQSESAGDMPQSERPDRSKAGKRNRAGDAAPDGAPDDGEGPSAGSDNKGSDSGNGAEQKRPPNRRRRIGGAGGASSRADQPRGDSAEDRLDSALEHIRAAQSRRLPDELPPAARGADRKDW
jgi:Ca-activated chloride channel homolog